MGLGGPERYPDRMNLKILALLVLAALLPVLLLWLRPEAVPASSVRYVVEVTDGTFDPPALQLEPGESVIWVWPQDTRAPHTVTAYHPVNDRPLRLPWSALPWDFGPAARAGTRLARRFQLEGVYDYFCRFHEAEGMVGRIVVGRPASAPAGSNGLPAAAGAGLLDLEAVLGRAGTLYRWRAALNAVSLAVREGDWSQAERALEETSAWVRVEGFPLLGELEAPARGAWAGLRRAVTARDRSAYAVERDRLKGLLARAQQGLGGETP